MTELIGALGATAGIILIVLLAFDAHGRRIGVWPPTATWQRRVFWTLFRALNISSLMLAVLDWQPMLNDNLLRLVAAATSLLGGAIYLAACLHLGRTNLYGGTAGLVTTGIYAWSRNPQYALAMPAYAALAVATQSMVLAALVGMLVVVFVLMALAEEPWLEATYGSAYRGYREEVPRFYNIRRAVDALQPSAARR